MLQQWLWNAILTACPLKAESKYSYLFLYTDIDECAEKTACCDTTCNNEDGTYSCSCNDGHFLSRDNCTCQGKSFME